VRQIENTIASLGFMKATDCPQFVTVCNIENGEIVDLPIKNGDFSWLCGCLPGRVILG